MLADHTEKLGFTLQARYTRPLVAIGAPSYALATGAAARLGAQLLLPEHAEVANAVGAITGTQTLRVEATITTGSKGYIVHAPTARREFSTLPEAKTWARDQVTALLDEQLAAEAIPGCTFHRELTITDHTGDSARGTLFLESRVSALARLET